MIHQSGVAIPIVIVVLLFIAFAGVIAIPQLSERPLVEPVVSNPTELPATKTEQIAVSETDSPKILQSEVAEGNKIFYTNDEYNFQFAYSPDWKILEEHNNSVTLRPKENGKIKKFESIKVHIAADYISPFCFEEVEMFKISLPQGWTAHKFIPTEECSNTESDYRGVSIFTTIEVSPRIVWRINADYTAQTELFFEEALRQIVETFEIE